MLLNWVKRIVLFLFLIIIVGVFWKIVKNHYHNRDIQELERTKEELKKLEQEKLEKEIEEIKKRTGLDEFSEFEENPNLLEKWLEKFATYWQIKYWLDTGIKPAELDFAYWIYVVKSQQFSDFQAQVSYQEPLWLKDNVNIEELRKEYNDSKNK